MNNSHTCAALTLPLWSKCLLWGLLTFQASDFHADGSWKLKRDNNKIKEINNDWGKYNGCSVQLHYLFWFIGCLSDMSFSELCENIVFSHFWKSSSAAKQSLSVTCRHFEWLNLKNTPPDSTDVDIIHHMLPLRCVHIGYVPFLRKTFALPGYAKSLWIVYIELQSTGP